MLKRTILTLLGATAVLFGIAKLTNHQFIAIAQTSAYKKAPEFHQTDPQLWLNSQPITMESLRGKVVMLDFWTFGCWNCYRSFPWMNEMETRLSEKDFVIIGVHTPEFEHEKVRAKIEQKIAKFKLKHPTVMDNDFRHWKAMNNRYWPTYYLIDKKGFIRETFIGETHANTPKARDIESKIHGLIAEPS